jgi:hypothetical protein
LLKQVLTDIRMDFFEEECFLSAPVPQKPTLQFLIDEEEDTRPESRSQPSSVYEKAFNLQAQQLSDDKISHNSCSRQDFVHAVLPAFESQKDCFDHFKNAGLLFKKETTRKEF